MTLPMDLPADLRARPLYARWYDEVADAPPNTALAAHPSLTREWAAAWQTLTTEPILAHRHLHLTDGVHSETVSYYLVDGRSSPYWTSQEADAGVPPVWPGTVVYAPSPHAEYGGAGSATPAMAAATVDHGQRLARDLGACAMVLPGLTADQATRWQAVRWTPLNLVTDWAYTAPVRASLSAFLKAAPTRHRREIGRQWRRGTEAGLELRPLTGPAMLPYAAHFADLANACSLRHGTPLYGEDMVRGLHRVPGAVLLAAHWKGTLVGGILAFLHRDCLYLWASGVDYNADVHRYTYTWLMAEAVQYAAAHDAHLIDAGRANHAYKRRLGFTTRELHTLVYLTSPLPGAAADLRNLADRLRTLADEGLTADQGRGPEEAAS